MHVLKGGAGSSGLGMELGMEQGRADSKATL